MSNPNPNHNTNHTHNTHETPETSDTAPSTIAPITATITANHRIFAMSAEHEPVLSVASGSRLRFETCDCFGDQIASSDTALDGVDWSHINPATGPVYIEGAEIGDTLAVHIERIELADTAVLATLPNLGVAGHRLTSSRIDIVPVLADHAVLFDRIKVPLTPMIGVIGTAPAGEAVSCGIPDTHGGNMDTSVIKAGMTVYLPVNVAGALLAMGDLHAGMGDGEVGVSGLEVRGAVEVQVAVIKGQPYPLPLVVGEGQVYSIASHADLNIASEQATLMMTDLMMSLSDLSDNQAIALQSIVGQLQICQVVDPNKTCRFALPLDILAQLDALPEAWGK